MSGLPGIDPAGLIAMQSNHAAMQAQIAMQQAQSVNNIFAASGQLQSAATQAGLSPYTNAPQLQNAVRPLPAPPPDPAPLIAEAEELIGRIDLWRRLPVIGWRLAARLADRLNKISAKLERIAEQQRLCREHQIAA